METKYDYIIVGAGFFGSIMARELTDAGAKCLVIEKRNHIGGNCYTENVDGIHVHEYGPHIFHTNNLHIWNYMSRYTTFNHFRLTSKQFYDNKLYSFPINLFTLYQLWGVITPEEAEQKLQSVIIPNENPLNFEEWILSKVGKEIYEKFIYDYTVKQWGTEPKNLPAFIIKRLPIRLTFDDNYYYDKYQGIPENGYTQIFEKLLEGIPLLLNTDYLLNKEYFDNLGKKIVYTGPIDEFFNYEYGHLEWRSLKFEKEVINKKYHQGGAVVIYPEKKFLYTRIIEHKHFNFGEQNFTIITREYPHEWNGGEEKYYPVNNEKNQQLYLKYKNQIDNKKYIFGGRLANYAYYDMHQVIELALTTFKNEIDSW